MGPGATATREKVVALWGDGKTSPEIAKALGITRGRVTAYVCDARDEGDKRAVRRPKHIRRCCSRLPVED